MGRKNARRTVSLPPTTFRRLNLHCQRTGEPKSKFVARALLALMREESALDYDPGPDYDMGPSPRTGEAERERAEAERQREADERDAETARQARALWATSNPDTYYSGGMTL